MQRKWTWKRSTDDITLFSEVTTEPNRAILVLRDNAWDVEIWNPVERDWIEHNTSYASLDEAKAVAWAMAAMHNKD